MIKFSVIIPTYNRAGFIAETVDTVLQQTYQNFEVIIVDDGSTDNTKEVIDEKYPEDSRVRYFYKPNEERGAARNFGMKQAKGDYAVIFDSDDWMHNDYLEILDKKISLFTHEKINFIATKYQLKEDSGCFIKGGSSNLKEGWYDYKILLKGNSFGCMYAVRLDNPNLKYFLHDRNYATLEDWIFILDNLRHDRLYLLDKISISVRHNENRSTANNQRVIKVRNLATKWILENISLSSVEQRQLIAWSHYYCGIHQYLDCKRNESVKESIAAIKYGGINKYFILLLVKSVIGRKLIKAFR